MPTGAVDEPDGGFAVSFLATVPIVARLSNTGELVTVQAATALPVVYARGISRDNTTGEHLVCGTGNDNMTYLFRLDSALAFNCQSTTYNWTDSLVTALVTAFPVTVTTGMLSSDSAAWTGHSATFSAVDACLITPVLDEVLGGEGARLRAEPNPAIGPVRITLPFTSYAEPGAVEVLNTLGRIMPVASSVQYDGTIALDLSDLPNGTYVVRVREHFGAGVVRVVVAH